MTPEHINSGIARALKGESQLDPEVLKIHGFSTATMRHLFNNLCNLEGAAYLEIGVFKGASFIAAFNNNPIHAVGIDDFSQDFSQGDIRTQLRDNLNRWKDTGRSVEFIEADCFGGDPALAHQLLNACPESGFSVFTYDGHHDAAPTAKALPAFFDLLADRFIYIVDDFHWESVRNGTIAGFQALDGRVNIVQKWFLKGARMQEDKIWWNGVFLVLCSKTK